MHVARAELNPGFDDKFLVTPLSGTTDRAAIKPSCITNAVRSALEDRLLSGTVASCEQDLFLQVISDVLDYNREGSRARTEKSAAGKICSPSS